MGSSHYNHREKSENSVQLKGAKGCPMVVAPGFFSKGFNKKINLR